MFDEKLHRVTFFKIASALFPAKGEFAPGIPEDRARASIPSVQPGAPQVWELALQKHEAQRAGAHADLRLVDPEGRAHSWAIPRGELPAPGGKVLAIPQPTHTRDYAARKGTFDIPEGYGAGKVKSEGLKPVEVVHSVPGRLLRFNVYGGKAEGNQEYALINTSKGQLLQNITATKEKGVPGIGGRLIPNSKPNYREMKADEVRFDDPNEIHQAKVDGAHVTAHLRAGKDIKFFSYRPTERATGVIEHTYRVPGFGGVKVPASLSGTVLRGELYGERKGRAIPAEELGGILNAGVWKSREMQKERDVVLKPTMFDVVSYKGKDMERAPYAEKLKVLREVQDKLPQLPLPPMAVTSKEKVRLFSRIQAGKEPITSEGIVRWKLDDSRPTKAKFRPDVDAEVVGVTMGKGKHEGRIGALKVKLPGKDVMTHVGTGFSDQLREELAQNPESVIGRVAKVRTMQVFPSGRLRAPSFAGFHIEKGKQN